MAEEGSPLISNQRLLTVVGVVIMVIIFFFLWTIRGCIPMPKGMKGGDGYVNIYSNLELKDAANTIARLKDLKIPFKVADNGTAISVPKDNADSARLGLAEKNLPLGGSVGWEIFNETKMGATDFDRRIQLIRAISGELSRTIRRIDGVEDARVQIVLPETKLFEVTKTPVTAAVLLKIVLGRHLRPDQVNGIIHLVASSVEDLKPENVTIVDDMGNILTGQGKKQLEDEFGESNLVKTTITSTTNITEPIEQQVIKKEQTIIQNTVQKAVSTPITATPSPSPTIAIAIEPAKLTSKPKVLSDEEKSLLKLKAKEEYERQLTAKVQELLNQFYPANKVIVRISILFGDAKPGTKGTKLKIHSDSGYIIAPIKKITAIVLVDNLLRLTPKVKKSTYQTISLALPYDKSRGDKVIIKQVPFHYAEPEPDKNKIEIQGIVLPSFITSGKYSRYIAWGSGGVLVILLIILFIRIIRPKQVSSPFESSETINTGIPSENEATTTVKQIKEIARDNPERLANLIKKWLTEEQE